MFPNVSPVKRALIFTAFVFGAVLSLLVSAFVPARNWTFLQWLFYVPVTGTMQELVGSDYYVLHWRFLDCLPAALHGHFLRWFSEWPTNLLRV
jgi:hypothetical protein